MKKFLFLILLLCSLAVNVDAAVLVSSSNGTYTAKTTLAVAATDVQCAGKTIIVTTPQVVSTVIAWPADRKLEVKKGGSISYSGSGAITGLLEVWLDWFAPDGGDTVGSEAANTVKIQAAINTAGTGLLHVSPGVYRHNALTVSESLTIKGPGIGADLAWTALRNMSASTGISVTATSFVMEDLILVGNTNTARTSTSGNALSINGDGGVHTINRVNIVNAGSYGLVLGGGVNTSVINIDNCYINGSTLSGIYGKTETTKQLNSVNITNSHIQNNGGHGVEVWANNLNINNNVIQGNAGSGVLLTGDGMTTTDSSMSMCTILNNYFEINGYGHIRGKTDYEASGPNIVHYVAGLKISGNYLSMKTADTGANATAPIQFSYTNTRTKQISGLEIGANYFDIDGTYAYVDFGGIVQQDSSVMSQLTDPTTTPTYYKQLIGADGTMVRFANPGTITASVKPSAAPPYEGCMYWDIVLGRWYRAQFNSTVADWILINNSPRSGVGAPGSTPDYIGEEYLDTTNSKWYKAKNTINSAGWLLLN